MAQEDEYVGAMGARCEQEKTGASGKSEVGWGSWKESYGRALLPHPQPQTDSSPSEHPPCPPERMSGAALEFRILGDGRMLCW